MSLGFDSAITGLQAARAALQTIGHNISNQATPGYSRQNVLLQAANPLAINGRIFGAGVLVGNITRSVDDLLIRRIQTQQSTFGYFDVQYQRLSELESIINEPSENGLSALASAFFSSVQQLSGDPASNEKRVDMISKSKSLTDSFNLMSSQLFQHVRDIDAEISNKVSDANSLAVSIAALNAQILAYEGGTQIRANDLRDQRDEAIKKLGTLVSISPIEDDSGAVRVQVGGFLLVSNTVAGALQLTHDSNNSPEISLVGSSQKINTPGGSIGGLVALSNGRAGSLMNGLNTLAYNLILEVNRAHSTGINKKGSFTSLTSNYVPIDSNSNGNFGDELLTNSGFPFAIQNGDLYINVQNQATKDIEKTKIHINPGATTMQGFADAISAIPNLSATVDGTGRLRIQALSGYAFDFSPRLDTNPNTEATFGGAAATVSSTSTSPFNLSNGDSMTINVNGVSKVVTFNTASFSNIAQATASEVAAVINTAFAGAPAASGIAKVVDGHLVIESTASPASGTTIQITDGAGSPAADMGLSTTLESGQDTGVAVTISGKYAGANNDKYTFKADQDGVIGETVGLTVGVFDEIGNRIATLDVGADYSIGTVITLPNSSGVQVSFGAGSISNTSGDFTSLDVVSQSDTADVLPGLGLNSYFLGSSASDIQVNPEIENDSDLIAASSDGQVGDNGALLDILNLKTRSLSNLGNKTIDEYYGNAVSGLGFDVSNAQQLVSSQQFIVDNLEIQRQQVSGVSVDEELTHLLQFQQMFEAVSRYISTVSELERGLVNSL